MLLTNYGNFQWKHQLFLFQSSCQCFISVLRNIDFLNRHWSCCSNFTFKLNLLTKITRFFLGINQHFLSNVVVVEKESLLKKRLQAFYSWHQSLCYHLKMLPSSLIVNEPTSLFRKLPVLFTSKEQLYLSRFENWWILFLWSNESGFGRIRG